MESFNLKLFHVINARENLIPFFIFDVNRKQGTNVIESFKNLQFNLCLSFAGRTPKIQFEVCVRPTQFSPKIDR